VEITIREHQEGDTETLCVIAQRAWEPIYAFFAETLGPELCAALYADWRQQKAGQVRRACQRDDPATVFVAESAGVAVGFVTVYADSRTGVGEIGNNAIDPPYQGQGIAQELYSRAMQYRRDAGMRFVRVSTGGDPAHAPARRAYARAGFDRAIPGVTLYRAL